MKNLPAERFNFTKGKSEATRQRGTAALPEIGLEKLGQRCHAHFRFRNERQDLDEGIVCHKKGSLYGPIRHIILLVVMQVEARLNELIKRAFVIVPLKIQMNI